MRYERKYKVEQVHPRVVEQIIRLHPAGFRPLFPPRRVHNLYFDTPDFAAFQDNVTGTPQRLKYRLRWYGAHFGQVANPVLEIKVKDNLLGWKKHLPLEKGQYAYGDFPALVAHCRQLTGKGLDLQPVLLNTYQRSYWTAPALPFRVTIDSELRFGQYAAGAPPRLTLRDESVVLEVKYDATADSDTAFVLQHLPFRLSKNSKYVTGINLVYG